jgi:hypothetical protein
LKRRGRQIVRSNFCGERRGRWASAGVASALRGARTSGTSERRKAPDTPNATIVASSASVLRVSADSAPTKRETS